MLLGREGVRLAAPKRDCGAGRLGSDTGEAGWQTGWSVERRVEGRGLAVRGINVGLWRGQRAVEDEMDLTMNGGGLQTTNG